MQREFSENLNKILQYFSETASDVAELNVDLLNRLSHTSITPSELGQIKRPEDWIRYLNSANLELMRYSQELSEIYVTNAQRFAKIMTDVGRATSTEVTRNVNKTVNKASKFAKKAKRKVRATA